MEAVIGRVRRFDGGLRSLFAVEACRLARDTKLVALLSTILAVPVLTVKWGGSPARLGMFAALFLPVAISWSWGDDLASGRLVQLALSRFTLSHLLFVRFALFGLMVMVLTVFAAALHGPLAGEDVILLAMFDLQIVLLGFFLCTWTGSKEIGWLPVFLALVGDWLPLLFMMKQTGSVVAPAWLRWITAALLPQFALELAFYSPRQLILCDFCLICVWGVLARVAVGRANIIAPRADG